MKTRFIQHIGTRIYLRVYTPSSIEVCSNCGGKYGYHDALIFLCDSPILFDNEAGGNVYDYPDERWPSVCSGCGKPFDGNAIRQIHRTKLYNTESGKPEKGDMFFREMHKPDEWCYAGWDNCDGKHLHIILPD